MAYGTQRCAEVALLRPLLSRNCDWTKLPTFVVVNPEYVQEMPGYIPDAFIHLVDSSRRLIFCRDPKWEMMSFVGLFQLPKKECSIRVLPNLSN